MSYWGMSIEVQIRSGWDIWEGETGHPDKGMSKNEELSPANKDYITFESITLIRVIKPEIFTYSYILEASEPALNPFLYLMAVSCFQL